MSAVGPTIDVRCPQCGAEPGEACTYVYGDGTPAETPGAERPDLHFYRTRLPRLPGDPLDRPPVDHGRTRERNQARLVRCSAGCGALVWLAGALPVAADAAFVCSSCDDATRIDQLPTTDLPLGEHQRGSGRRFLPGQCHLHPTGEGCRCTQ